MNTQTMTATPALDEHPGARDLGGLLGLSGASTAPFPLREVRVRASIVANCCRTVVEQLFDNPHDAALEAVHIFPLPPDGAVTEMELRAGDVTVRAECREREDAARAFDEARAGGRRAALLERERPDVHTVRVTNIPARASVSVRLVVVERLRESDGRYLWRFPTVVAPRYMPGTPTGHAGPGTTPDTTRVPDASRLQPPLLLGDGARLDLEVEITGGVAQIESSLHAVRATLGTTVRVAPSTRATLDRDFVLRFTPETNATAPVRAYADGDFTMLVVNPSALAGRLPAGGGRIARDAVFVIDISGSMEGRKLDSARRAVSAALRGLERGDRFRLVAFDDRVEVFERRFSDFTAEALAAADAWIARLESRGGTEMLPALREALAGDRPADRLRTILFVTDGQAGNEDELVAEVARQAVNAAVFTVGIDTAVNGSLLERLARAGHGTCELLTPRDDVEEAIARLEARFGAPIATGLGVSAGEPARPGGTAVFEGRPEPILVRGGGSSLVVSARTPAGELSLPCPPPEPLSFPLGALWARERVAWLDDQLACNPQREAEFRAEMLPLALAHHIASRYTSFVAVEEKRNPQGELVTVVQPALLPVDWSDNVVAYASAPMPLVADDVDELAMLKDAAPRARRAFSIRAITDRLPSMTLRRSAPPPVEEAPRPRESADLRRRVESDLAVSQDADGSFGGSVERTAAALVALALLGHTPSAGARRRVVAKALAWLAERGPDPVVERVLALLSTAESDRRRIDRDECVRLLGNGVVGALVQAGPEGRMLGEVLGQEW
jgi:Ca-activated chloride channel family protein